MKSCFTKGFVIVLASAAIISVAYYFYGRDKALPIIRPAQVQPDMVDPSVRLDTTHRVSHFSLLDQQAAVTDSNFTAGKIHVADFFFTTCKTICPIMSAKMQTVADQFDIEDDVRFLSFSVIPKEDTPEVLNEYANAYGINYNQWRLLTGDKEMIYDLARKSYFTLKPTEVGQGDGGEGDFIHTNNFVLVDSRMRLRGYYDGVSDLDMERLARDIKILLKEEAKLSQPK